MLQEQLSLHHFPPPPPGQNLDRWIRAWKHGVASRNLLPTAEAYFSFQSYVFILLFLYCYQKMKHSCSQVYFSVFVVVLVVVFFLTELFISCYVEEVAKGFIDDCVCDCSCRLLRWTIGKIFLCRHKIKYSCYQDSFVILGWRVNWVFCWEMHRLIKSKLNRKSSFSRISYS